MQPGSLAMFWILLLKQSKMEDQNGAEVFVFPQHLAEFVTLPHAGATMFHIILGRFSFNSLIAMILKRGREVIEFQEGDS